MHKSLSLKSKMIIMILCIFAVITTLILLIASGIANASAKKTAYDILSKSADSAVAAINAKAQSVEYAAGEALSYASLKKSPKEIKRVVLEVKNAYYESCGISVDYIIGGTSVGVSENKNYSNNAAFLAAKDNGSAFAVSDGVLYYACSDLTAGNVVVCIISDSFFENIVDSSIYSYYEIRCSSGEIIASYGNKMSASDNICSAESNKDNLYFTAYIQSDFEKTNTDLSGYFIIAIAVSVVLAAAASIIAVRIAVKASIQTETTSLKNQAIDEKYNVINSNVDNKNDEKENSINNQEIVVQTQIIPADNTVVFKNVRKLADISAETAYDAAAISDKLMGFTDMYSGISAKAENAAEKISMAGNALEAEKSKMDSLINAIEDINKHSAKIKRVISDIEDIAFQTNILALNAAIEAARAGESGRGFAIVADEVRSLAAQSAESAKSTAEIIDGTTAAVKAGSSIAAETAQMLTETASASDEAAAAIKAIQSGMSKNTNEFTKVYNEVCRLEAKLKANAENANKLNDDIALG